MCSYAAMKYSFFAVVLTASVVTTPLGASPREPELLAPSSPWNVNYGDDSCRLARVFGADDAMTFVVLDQFAPGDAFKLTLGGKRFRYISNGGRASVRFGPDEAEQTREYFTGNYSTELPALILRGDIRLNNLPPRSGKQSPLSVDETPPLSPARIAAVNELIIGRPLSRPVKFALGSMRAPVAALNKCLDNLLTNWGIDVARHATLSRRAKPTGNPSSWIVSGDYPLSAVFRGAQGIVNFRLSIGPDGQPTSCHIQQSSRPPEFDTTVCKALMRRARFTPALDKDRQPLASYFRGTVVFKTG